MSPDAVPELPATPPVVPSAAPPGLRLHGLTLRHGARTIFAGLDLLVDGGEFLVLLGPSGVGKTGLLRIAAGLSPPQAGTVSATDDRPLAGRVAVMAQQDLLLPWASVIRNVCLGARLRGERPDRARALHLLRRVGLGDRADAMPATLSGGMRQRVAIARTLYEDRPFVLMDEPFAALDTVTRTRVQDLAAELLAGRTVLLITHDPLEACRLGHRLVVLSGEPARLGPPIRVPGRVPRPPDDPVLLRTQGELMRLLTGSHAPASRAFPEPRAPEPPAPAPHPSDCAP